MSMEIEYVKALVDEVIKRGDVVRYTDDPETTYLVIETEKGLGIAGLETGFTYARLPRDRLRKVNAKLLVEDKQ